MSTSETKKAKKAKKAAPADTLNLPTVEQVEAAIAEVDAQLMALHDEESKLKERARSLTKHRNVLLAQMEVVKMPAAKRAALTIVLGVQGIPSGEAVGTPQT